MHLKTLFYATALIGAASLLPNATSAQIGHRFPSEKKVVPDPVTNVPLTFLTSTPVGDSKIYQTHAQWTSDGKWVVFRSNRVKDQAMAVNEETGVIVQLTEDGYMGMLCLAHHSMKLYLMRDTGPKPTFDRPPTPPADNGQKAPGKAPAEKMADRGPRWKGPFQIVEVNLADLFADSEAGTMKPAAAYERICGTTAPGLYADGNMDLDANEDFIYFRVNGEEVSKLLPADQKPAEKYGPRGMGAGPTGLASMNLQTGEVKMVVTVPFQIGHVQTNHFVPGEIIFCWETGGKAPQRTWTVRSDGTGLRPLYPEAEYDWVTHEAVITKDEVALAIMGHNPVGTKNEWGISGTREHATGLAIINLRTREMRMAGQTHSGSGLWHVNGSADGRWAVGDDFARNVYLIDRHTDELILLSTGHKTTASDHTHPTFNADGTKIEIQSAMLSENGRSMNICVIPIPKALLDRTYDNQKLE